MSTLGQNVIPTPTIGPSGGGSPNCGGGFLDTICSAGESAAGAVVSAAASVESLAAGAITKQLGIKQYYSLHLTDVCQGDFQPDPTDKNAKPDIASCTKPFDTGDTDILGILNQELDIGPLKIDLSKLGFTQDLENAFQLIPRVLAVTGYFFLLASLLTGLLMVCTAAVAFLGDGSMERVLVLTLLAVSSLSWLMTFMGAIVLTIGEEKVRKEVNDKGNGIGIFASSGSAFFFLVWMAAILTTSVLVTSVIRFRSKGSGSGGGVGGMGAAPDPMSNMEAQKQQPYGMGGGGHDVSAAA
ncbi:hypothetical protein QBC46DRAFT_386962 [Diplogelasinospora grovesii]|uniref:Uncharacterized protein n=1 Tax=Diplogelasinospora grovesii TaxID=303347 RepID=A0AAN6S439_9PEZI|nr:hypothetical protein QBC46DRAFT_386962 [Diplogelasinospora grovesii]